MVFDIGTAFGAAWRRETYSIFVGWFVGRVSIVFGSDGRATEENPPIGMIDINLCLASIRSINDMQLCRLSFAGHREAQHITASVGTFETSTEMAATLYGILRSIEIFEHWVRNEWHNCRRVSEQPQRGVKILIQFKIFNIILVFLYYDYELWRLLFFPSEIVIKYSRKSIGKRKKMVRIERA